jgi:N-acetylmuramoyl-L-alanine amidase
MLRRLAGAVVGRGLLVAALAAGGFTAVAARAWAEGALLNIRLGGDAAMTRIVIDLDRSVSAKVVADGAADRRMVLMLPGVAAAEDQAGTGRGLVSSWAIDQTVTGARLRLDLAGDGKIQRRFLLPPADGVPHYRYVIDVAPAPAATAVLTKATPLTPAAPAAPAKKVIVIDAGHGGRDIGATGAHGFEKDVNLAAAQALKTRLERTGRYRVVMTRDTDVYVPLEDRVRVAQRADADLFISLHADSGPEASLRGASVYTLSDKASRRGAKFTSRDDWFMKAGLNADRGVSDILFDLTQRATRNRSATFAQTLVSNIEGKTPMLRRSHRDAGFMVLLAPDVPAVLLEMGFLSNSQDEKMLRDPVRRARLMDAVGDSIDVYFAQSIRLAAR